MAEADRQDCDSNRIISLVLEPRFTIAGLLGANSLAQTMKQLLAATIDAAKSIQIEIATKHLSRLRLLLSKQPDRNFQT